MAQQSSTNEVQKASGKKYAELQCDFMFKRLFGTDANKDILIGFLNMILEDVVIDNVAFIKTEHLGISEEDKKVIFDIECKCKDGTDFIIEMQKGYQKHFRERAVYYTTYPISEQGRHAHDNYLKKKAGGGDVGNFNWEYNLKPVIVIAIVNFKFKHTDDWPEDKYRSSYRLREDSYKDDIMPDVLRYVFLELGRFNKCLWEISSIYDKWMYLLKHIHEMVEIPKEFSDPFFTRLFKLAEIDNFTPEEKKQYYKSLKNMGDYLNTLNSTAELAREEGRAEGRAEGEEIGIEKGRRIEAMENARRLKSLGVSIDIISQGTGLPVEEIEKL